MRTLFLLSVAVLGGSCLPRSTLKPQAIQHNDACLVALDAGDCKAATAHCDHALEFNPDYHEARFNLARTYQSMGRAEDAEKHLRQLLATNPSIADAQNLLGILRLEAGDMDEALARFDAAVLLVPDHPDYHFNRGVAY